jgi:hypothetical protein
VQGALFGATCLLGIAPTLWANTVNAGSPLSTTYGSGDAVPMDWTFSIVPQYARDLQGPLLLLTIAWTAAVIFVDRDREYRRLATLVALNLGIGVLYFMTHPIFTPYYIIPLMMLSIWTLLYGDVLREGSISPARVLP